MHHNYLLLSYIHSKYASTTVVCLQMNFQSRASSFERDITFDKNFIRTDRYVHHGKLDFRKQETLVPPCNFS